MGKLKWILTIVLGLVLSLAKGEHYMGTKLTYTYLGDNNYEVKLIVYRDCFGITLFDNPVYISIYSTAAGALDTVLKISNPDIATISSTTAGCSETFGWDCIQSATYIDTVTILPLTGGYDFSYGRCCRENNIINIDYVGDTGTGVTTHIPGPEEAEMNNSANVPVLSEYFACLGQPFVLDCSATDADNDSLTYNFYDLFTLGSQFEPFLLTPYPPPFNNVEYIAGFSGAYPITSSPAMEINSLTGVMTGVPTAEGYYAVGVAIGEYRGGVLINTVYHEFVIVVGICDLLLPEIIVEDSITVCNELTIEFENSTDPGVTSFWDFGDGITSTEYAPVHTFPSAGNYSVMYQISLGTECSSTKIIPVNILAISLDPAAIDIEGSLTNCYFDTLILNAVSGTSYVWTDLVEGTIISTENEIMFTQAPGTHSIMLESADNDFCYVSLPLEFVFYDSIAPTIAAVNIDDDWYLSCGICDNPDIASIAWYADDELIPAATSSSILLDTCSDYYVEVIDVNNCVYRSEEEYFCAVNNVDISTMPILIQPNPNNGIFDITLPVDLEDVTIQIYNILGKSVEFNKQQTQDKLQIQTATPAGLYIVQLSFNEKTWQQTIVIR